ncbi:MAG TPA: phosphate acyltransferase PlsX [Gemmatimonadaceae bacterium]|nr:phosphate acyltransferase PlsX [Gemmatimonadaceae bacterium]
MARIALDAMGGDFAPRATIAGALQALNELDKNHAVQLVGRTSIIEQELAELLSGELSSCAPVRDRISIVEAPDLIDMADKPTVALRGKPNNPMSIGLRMQTEGKSDGFVSAGNTGAQMAVSAILLGLHAGLKRPPVSTILPTSREPIVFLDSGANVDCSPAELVQFAWLGSVYAETVLGRKDPVVGLLSIGEEESKGNAISKEAHNLFRAAGFNFQGNIEGRDLPPASSDRGPVDVVVCDGFVGNVVLKFYEGVIPMIVDLLERDSEIDMLRVKKALSALDSSAYGGAPLLGVRGVSMICHGNSTPRAIKNAIGAAVRAVESKMSDRIGEKLAALEKSAGETRAVS